MKIIKTGIHFIDVNFGCLRPNEFMLLGAGTGIGKTSLANAMAWDMAAQGAKVALFSLENTAGDTRTRLAYNKWREDAQQYYYPERLWKIEADRGEHDEYLVYAEQQLKNIKLLEVRGEAPNILKIQSLYAECQHQGVDVVILDHLDYIKQENNNLVGHMNQLVGTLKNLIEMTDIPCIAFSHLAKVIDPRKFVPSLDDFYGSSNKTKVCTSAITMARDYETDSGDSTLCPTYFAIRKDRYGTTTGNAGRLLYDIKTQRYLDEYEPLKISTDGTKWLKY